MSNVPGSWLRAVAGAGLLSDNGTISPTIFAEMSAEAVRTGAINLGQGFPDYDGPSVVLDAARKAIADGFNQYPPGRGIPELREAIAAHQLRFYGLAVDPETEVIVTAGATEALTSTLLGLTDGPEDEVIVFEPHYDSYAAAVALAGATLRTVPLRAPTFQPDLDQLTDAFSERTRLIVVNDPHNPTGARFTDDVRRTIVREAAAVGAIIVTDEVYEHLTFDGPHLPLAALPGAAERTITISSAGKTFSATGWKVGWAHGPADLITAILSVKQYLTYVNASPFQPAIALGLGLGEECYSQLTADLFHQQRILGSGLREAGFVVHEPQGGYFTLADATVLGGADADAFARALPGRVGVVAIPLTAFVSATSRDQFSGLIRFAACKRPEVLHTAAERLLALRR